jgi:16S rRNA (cytidine1402-2'-O)-methyltransferase
MQNADVVVFEEDRGARSALKRAGITRDYLKWNEHQDKGTWEEITKAFSQNSTVLYMPDQGMPGSADPGAKLSAYAHTNQIPIRVLPGPTSIAAALAAFPHKVRHYFFAGFPPREQRSRKKFLQFCNKLGSHCVLMDTPYRLQNLLEEVKAVYGGKSKGLLAMDLETTEEEFVYATINEHLSKEYGKRLFVLVLPTTFVRSF